MKCSQAHCKYTQFRLNYNLRQTNLLNRYSGSNNK